MKYLVLGSSGQIGNPLCEYLKKEGHDVQEFDIQSDETQEDLRNEYCLRKMVFEYKPDFVFFLAFDVGGSRYLKHYQNTTQFLNNNVMIMKNTFQILENKKIPFIFASSQMSNMNHSSYGILKALGEYYTKILNGLTVKFWNVYGIERDLEKAHVITDFILKAKNTGMIDSMTDGTEMRQFLHTDDSSNALYTLSQKFNELEKDKNYHITSFDWTTIKEIAYIISDSGYYPELKIKFSDVKDGVQKGMRNEPDDFILKYWQPKVSMHDGIKSIIDYYEEQK